MANPLEMGTVSPPPPNPEQGNALQQGGAPQAMPAPPSHEQTVAFLRHADAVKAELTTLLKNPALGKSDLKSAIIDGVTKLVAERFMKPAEAVIQLADVPKEPLQQRKWVQTKMAQTVQSENSLLDHYGAGNPSLLSVQEHFATSNHGNPDDHQEHMSALAANYGGARG